MACKPKIQNKLLSSIGISVGGALTFIGINVYKGNESFYSGFLMPLLHRVVDAESAHKLAIYMAKRNIVPNLTNGNHDLSVLRTSLWGLNLDNPIGLAAGFDKNGEAIAGLTKFGFGFIEVGSVTPKAQPGNPKPRVFRLTEDKAIINRYGFNSDGQSVVVNNLKGYYSGESVKVPLGLNLGKNKDTKDGSMDYVEGLRAFKDVDGIDYFVINISSPNTPGLRGLQNKAELTQLLNNVLKYKHQQGLKQPLLVKISPDLSPSAKADIADVLLKTNVSGCKVEGVIVSNTTVTRPDFLKSSATLKAETGGLSGVPLRQLSTDTIKDMYRLTKGQIPIVGVGGVFSGKDAYEKIKAGASLIQIYSSLAYEGPPVVRKIKSELATLLKEDGFTNIASAVGRETKIV